MTTDDAAPDRGPLLKLGDREFRCVDHVATWQTMKMSAAYASGDTTRVFSGMYEFLGALIHPDEWSAFEAHATAIDAGLDDLDTAIGDALAAMAGRGKGSAESSTPSSDGLPTPETPPTSRVVSLSRGTVEEVPADQSAGPTSSTG
jgi:hypothetical protein